MMRDATTQSKCRRYGIETAAAQRLATQDAPQRQHAAACGAETLDGIARIVRTTRMETATRAEQGAQPAFVRREQGEQNPAHDMRSPRGKRPRMVDMQENQGLPQGGT